jgi:hypothetical protein
MRPCPAENSVLAFPLDDSDPPVLAKRMERISSRASYFSAGYCLKRTLICVVKTNRISSTVKVLEPINANARPERKRKSGFGRFFQAREETFNKVKVRLLPVYSQRDTDQAYRSFPSLPSHMRFIS